MIFKIKSNIKTLNLYYIFVLLLFILPIACSVGPNYVKPSNEVKAGSTYKETGEWKIAEARDHVTKGNWWEIFNNSELNSMEDQINISNQNLAIAEAQYREAQALVQSAHAGYFPTLSIGASLSHSLGSTSLPNSGGRTSNSFSLPLSVSWEPDLWGRVRRTVEASKANAQASAADLQSTRLLVQSNLALNYFQLRILDLEQEILDSTVAAYQKYYDLTNNRYSSGVVAKSDVLQAEAQLKTTRAQAIDLGVERAQLEHAIALLLGKPAYAFSVLVANLNMNPPGIPAGIPSELLERRPDIAAAERRLAASNAEIGIAKAAYYPNITLGASAGFTSTDNNMSKWLSWPSRFFVVGPSVSETIFDGGLRKAQTEQARAAFDASLASYKQTILGGFQEVEDNLAALRILENEASVQNDALKASELSLESMTNQYKAGTVSYLNVIIAQSLVLTNKRTAAEILNRRMAASVLLIKALGGGWKSSDLPK